MKYLYIFIGFLLGVFSNGIVFLLAFELYKAVEVIDDKEDL